MGKSGKGRVKMCEISIIIPVFNAEKSLPVCVDSLKRQTHASFEVLLVDDGSSDRSGEICDRISEQDNRFRVIHQNNSGPSAARNVGLDNAQGNIIAFVDSDDSVEPDYIECIVKAFEKQPDVQIVFIGYKDMDTSGRVRSMKIPSLVSENVVRAIEELSKQDMFGYTWIKAFRCDVIKNVRFAKEISLFEDEIFTCNAIKATSQISVVPKAIYHYVRGNPNALMGRTRQDFCQLQDQVFLAWKDMIGDAQEYQDILIRRASAMVTICQFYFFERSVEQNQFLLALKNSAFFQCSQKQSDFSKLLDENKLFALKKMRIKYRLKVAVSKLLHR